MMKDCSSKIKINMTHPIPHHHLKNIWDTGLMQVPFHIQANISTLGLGATTGNPQLA